MKVIGFNGSPHEKGTTWRGMTAVAGELEKAGIEVELVQVGGREIPGCTGCRSCFGTGRCRFDDMVNECAAKLAAVEGIILGSPVYYGGIAGGFKCFLDRLFYLRPHLRLKVGTTVTALRRTGGILAHQQLNNYLNLAEVIIAPAVYWNVIHGNGAEEALQDGEGMMVMRTAGRNMAWLIKSIAAGAVPFPETEPRVMTNFIR